MLSCRACSRRFLQAELTDSLGFILLANTRKTTVERDSFGAQCRRASTATAATRTETDSIPSKQLQWMQRNQEKINTKRLQKEVVWLKDPAKLASHTAALLQDGQREKALDLVRVAGKNGSQTVSWNHIINDDMNNGRVNLAFQTYNEMKKRAQIPDAYTYTILFRGFAANTGENKSSLERAIKIYHSMFAETSPVRPSTIHTNAVLNVCARAGDLDALFGIAAKLPVSGPGAPDNYTFTTIINCIRTVAWTGGKDIPHELHTEKLSRRRKAVAQGKKIWSEIIDRWKRGKLKIDEELVCAMGRLLLLSNSYVDCDNVLSLVEQTMFLPREIPPIGDPARNTNYRWRSTDAGNVSQSTNKQSGSSSSEVAVLMENDEPDSFEENEEQDTVNVFAPVTKTGATRVPAIPGQNTLSLLVDACTRMNAIEPAQAYWAKITSKVKPDLENYHTYLRLLRVSRSSGLVVDLLKELVSAKKEGGLSLKPMAKTFRIAMSACTRDINNPAIVGNATAVLSLMQKHIEDPDIRTGTMFVEIIEHRTGTEPLERMQMAMEVLEDIWRNIRGIASYGSWSPKDADTRDDFEPSGRAGFEPGLAKTRAVDDEYWKELYHLAGLYSRQIARYLDKYRDQLSNEEMQLWKGRSFRKMLRRQHPARKIQPGPWSVRRRGANPRSKEKLLRKDFRGSSAPEASGNDL